MAQDTQPSIGKRYWRCFVPIWLFPVAFLATLVLPGFSTHSAQYLLLLDLPLLCLCAYPALRRWRDGGITFAQMFIWFAIVPVLTWSAMVFGIFGLAYLTGAHNS